MTCRFGPGAAPAALALLLLASATAVHAEESIAEAGLLTCQSVPGTRLNLLIHSRVDVRCDFRASDGRVEYYKGTTGIGLGLDLNWDRSETMMFTVLAAGDNVGVGTHALAGNYGGGKASITAGGGIGAAALIGGSTDHIALEPIAFEHSTGLGLSAGLTWLHLEPSAK